METRLLDILVCPLCKGRLYLNETRTELICRGDRLAYPIQDGVPVMLEAQARSIGADDDTELHALSGISDPEPTPSNRN
ncbi:MAG: Trm112 family protein [Alcaligenaceae bacterium]